MSIVDEGIIPVLFPLIKTCSGIRLSVNQTNQIAIWATLKIMCLTAHENSGFFSEIEYKEFYTLRKIPSTMLIFIGRLKSRFWELSWRGVRAEIRSGSDEATQKYRLDTLVWGIGGILIFVVRNKNSLMAELKSDKLLKLHRISPLSGKPVVWSFAGGLRTAEVDGLAHAILALPTSADPDRIVRHKMKLAIDASMGAATVLMSPVPPGDEFVDLHCGDCDNLVGQSVSTDTVRRRASARSKLLIECTRCGKHNIVPVRMKLDAGTPY